ncbi:MAG: response regulator transcription factor [Chloroflexota bacterium]|nr:response regulator transcription factor [Chloroflexota bacterium]
MSTILIVEDEKDLNSLIQSHLEPEGHTVLQAYDGRTALELVEEHHPDLVILDWMLPELDGLAVCRQIRQNHLTPILMLTARSEEIDRVLGLEVGADDYVVKPFSIRELIARVRSILRRVALDTTIAPTSDQKATHLPAPEPVVRGPLRIDEAGRIVTLDGSQVDLTRREFDLLLLLASHPGRAFSREFLLDRLWGYEYDGFDRTVDNHIAQLRRKLGSYSEHITTVWGIGYRFIE